ncbi:MAG: HD domain-containing protein, partial [Candidatus Omnitrophica bacterium]|nr:HD domain-containing protein [Candidatus Omnitrophota bacterium]
MVVWPFWSIFKYIRRSRIHDSPLTTAAVLAGTQKTDRETTSDMKAAIDASHANIAKTPTVRKQFLALVQSAGQTAKGILEFLKPVTILGAMGYGKPWNFSTKGSRGDGAWWVMQAEHPEFVLPDMVQRDEHIRIMVEAVDDLLAGRMDVFVAGPHKILTGKTDPRASPGVMYPLVDGKQLTMPKLRELAGRFGQNNSLSDEKRLLLLLGAVLHDYGRLLEGKNLSLTRRGKVVSSEGFLMHRDSGALLARDLLTALKHGDRTARDIVEFLVRRHDAAWSLYARETYGQKWGGGYESTEALVDEVASFVNKHEGRISLNELLKMMAAIGVADVHASGDRYLSDDFVDFAMNLMDLKASQPTPGKTIGRKVMEGLKRFVLPV